MSTSDSADMKYIAPIAFDWILKGDKIRDGRYGPVFLAMRTDTAELIAAEKLEVDVGLHLENKQIHQSEPNIVSCLGYQRKGDHIFILTEYPAAGTLRELIQKYGAIRQPLARVFLRQIVLGLEQLQKQGIAVVFLDSRNIVMLRVGIVKIEAPLLDVTVTGQSLPPGVLTLPELMGQRNLRKADIWLLGIIVAQMLSGDCNLATADLASYIATQIKEDQESASEKSAWELFISKDIVSKLDKQTSDFLRQCLIM